MSTKNFGIQSQQLKHLSKKEYLALKELSFLSKNMYNVTLYNIRQYYFNEKKYLSYESNYHLCKDNENYRLLNSNSAQQIMKVVDRSFKSFFKLLQMKNNNIYHEKINIPHYLEKESYFNLIFSEFSLKKNTFIVPMSPLFKKLYGKVSIKVPSNLHDKKIKEIRILPKNNARFFEVQYIYEIETSHEKKPHNHLLAIDLGIDNLMTCTTNKGHAFIIDGKKLKSKNTYTNKRNAYLQHIKDKQKIAYQTKQQMSLWTKRNHYVKDYLHKSCKKVIDYCLDNQIDTIILGYNTTIQKGIHLGKVTNQNFVNLPIGQIRTILSYLCERVGIHFETQEESYTSKASFLDNDVIPTYSKEDGQQFHFSGKRIHRGLYQSKDGKLLNADINGSLNIMRKWLMKNKKEIKIELISKEYVRPKRIYIV